MNPVFWLIVILIVVVVWYLLSDAFGFIGKTGEKIKDKIKDNINKDDNDKKHTEDIKNINEYSEDKNE